MGEKENKTIIFFETKRKTDDITRKLRKDGWPAMCIHGDKSQPEREWVLKEFRSGKAPILLATDVASRGLDIPDISFVVNFDYPNSGEDYIHRIGRTARAERTGTAYTFFTHGDSKNASELVSVMEEAGQTVPPKLQSLAGNSYGGGRKRQRYSSESNDRAGSKRPSSSYGGSSAPKRGSYSGGARGGHNNFNSGSSGGQSQWNDKGSSWSGQNNSGGGQGGGGNWNQGNSSAPPQGSGNSQEQWAKYHRDMAEWQKKNDEWQQWQTTGSQSNTQQHNGY